MAGWFLDKLDKLFDSAIAVIVIVLIVWASGVSIAVHMDYCNGSYGLPQGEKNE